MTDEADVPGGWVARLVLQSLANRHRDPASKRAYDPRQLSTAHLFTSYRAQRGELGDSGRVAVRRAIGRLRDDGLVRQVPASESNTGTVEVEGMGASKREPETVGANRTAVWEATEAGMVAAKALGAEYDEERRELNRQYGVLDGRFSHSERVLDPVREVELPELWSREEDRRASYAQDPVITFEYERTFPQEDAWSLYGIDSPRQFWVQYSLRRREFVLKRGAESQQRAMSADTVVGWVRESFDRQTAATERQRLRSTLRDIQGIGEKTREALLESFETLEAVRDAEEDDLVRIPGIGPETARRLRNEVLELPDPQVEIIG